MSRSRHVALEREEGAVHGGRGQQQRRRAELEEQLARASAAGNTEMVARVREELALIEASA